jgi:8-oxo-dGTP diphosphatase
LRQKEYCYQYPRPAVTVDIVLIRATKTDLEVLLIQRGHPPFEGCWALPGGFVDENEALDRAAIRELLEETGITGIALSQLGAFGDPGRDPRGHTVSIAFGAISRDPALAAKAADDAAAARWFSIEHLPALAFDHHKIISKAFERFRGLRSEPFYSL